MAALTRFFELHAERAGLEGTIRHPDVFRDPPAREFLRDYCALGAARGEVHVFCLKVGEEVIAVRIGFRSGDSMYLYYSGYDTKYARYSVMTHCLAEALRWSIEAGVKEVNLSIGTDVSKTRWSPQQHLFHSGKLLSPNLRGRAVHGAYQWLSQRLRDERIRGLSRVFGRRRG